MVRSVSYSAAVIGGTVASLKITPTRIASTARHGGSSSPDALRGVAAARRHVAAAALHPAGSPCSFRMAFRRASSTAGRLQNYPHRPR